MSVNVTGGLKRWANRSGSRDALVFEQASWTYAELDHAVDLTSGVLVVAGITRGDRVLLLGMNSDEYVIALLAVSRIGAVSVPLNFRLHTDELAFLAGDSGAVGLLIDADFASRVEAVTMAMPEVKFVATLNGVVGDLESLSESRGRNGLVAPPIANVGGDDLDRILYTSGTTSRPKGVCLSHANAAWNRAAQVAEGCLGLDERVLAFAPLYHIGAQELPGLRVFDVGACMVVMRRFDARSVLAAVQDYSITGMPMVATMVHMLRDVPDRAEFDTSSLRWTVFGQIPVAMFDDLRALFPNAMLMNSYGLTETCSSVSALDPDHEVAKPGSVGRPVAHVDVAVVDGEDRPVGVGALGEIVVRGPKVMSGYFGRPDDTEQALRGGWLHTGDIGYLDEDGFLYVVDRLKDMIRSGGENVASQEIEAVIHEIEAVAECAVVAHPDSVWQEVPRAVVVVRPGSSVSAAEITEHCRGRLAAFKVPKLVEFIDQLPRNPSGKVLKRELRTVHNDGEDRP